MRDVLKRELALTDARQPYARVTVTWSQGLTSGKVGNQAVVEPDGTMTGWIGGACSREQVLRHCLKALESGEPRVLCLGEAKLFALGADGRVHEPVTCASEGALEIFIEPRIPATQLVVVGDAPVARTLCRLGRALGYEVVAVLLEDHDPEEADRVVHDLTPEALTAAGVGDGSFVVVATMGQYDEEAVYCALKTRASFTALVASERRGGAVRAALAQRDVCSNRLSRLRAPAGLDLGAVPHEEIAVAVLAEIVQAKAQGIGRPKIRVRPTEEATDPVCGMTVDLANARYTAAHEGHTYAFCCMGCRDRFEADPSHWLKRGQAARR